AGWRTLLAVGTFWRNLRFRHGYKTSRVRSICTVQSNVRSFSNMAYDQDAQKKESPDSIQLPSISRETAGAVAGATLGSIAGPVGTVVGGVVGAIAARSGSAKRVVRKTKVATKPARSRGGAKKTATKSRKGKASRRKGGKKRSSSARSKARK